MVEGLGYFKESWRKYFGSDSPQKSLLYGTTRKPLFSKVYQIDSNRALRAQQQGV